MREHIESRIATPPRSPSSAHREIVKPLGLRLRARCEPPRARQPRAGLRLDRGRERAEARHRAAAERGRIERDDQLPGAGRRALRVEIGRRLGRDSSSRSGRRRAARPSARARCPWRRPSAPWCRASAASGSVVGLPAASSAQPSGIFSPRCFAVMTLPRATLDSDRSITSGARPGSGQANATGLVPNTGFEPPHGAIAPGVLTNISATRPALRQPLDRLAGRAAMAGAADRRGRDALPPRQRRAAAASAASIAGNAKPLRGVDRDQAGPRLARRAAPPGRRPFRLSPAPHTSARATGRGP